LQEEFPEVRLLTGNAIAPRLSADGAARVWRSASLRRKMGMRGGRELRAVGCRCNLGK
jgi:hypothetical protein